MAKTLNNMTIKEMEYLFEKARICIDYTTDEIILNAFLVKLLGHPYTIGMYFKDRNLVILPNGNIPIYSSFGNGNGKKIVIKSVSLIKNISLLFGIDSNTKKSYRLCKMQRMFYSNSVEVKLNGNKSKTLLSD